MKRYNKIFARAASLLLAFICLLPLTSCFDDNYNWNFPERSGPEFDLGMLLGALSPGDIGEKESLPSGVGLTLSKDGEYFIVSSAEKNGSKKIVIPMSYKGIPIREIADSAFAGFETLEEISLPESITRVGAGVFEGCDSLEYTEYGGALYLGNDNDPYLVLIRGASKNVSSVTIHENTRVIAAEAFLQNMAISEIVIPDDVLTIGKKAFGDCSNIYRLEIGDGTELIDDAAFSGLEALSELSFGSSVATVGEEAFMGTNSLESLDIPDSVTEIGPAAFYGCSRLEKVTLGEGVRVISEKAFASCTALQQVKFGGSIEVIGDMAFDYCTALESVILPSSIELIFPDSFRGCPANIYTVYSFGCYLGSAQNPYEYLVNVEGSASALSAFSIHPDTRCIAAGFFSEFVDISLLTPISNGKYLHISNNCVIDTREKKLIAGISTSIIPSDGSVTSIGDYAFYKVRRLTLSSISADITEIGDNAFENCSYIKSLAIFGAIKIGKEAFQGCSGLISLSFRDPLESIGDSAFKNCIKLENVVIPYSVTELGTYAFANCTSLETAVLGSELDRIPEGAFMNCSKLRSVTHSQHLVSIGDSAFEKCRKLESFNFNEGLEYIGGSAFGECESLMRAGLPNSVTDIGSFAFSKCPKIYTLTLGSGVKRIGEGAFSGLECEILYNGMPEDWKKIAVGEQDPYLRIRFIDDSECDFRDISE